MQMVLLLEHRRPEPLVLPERQTHLRNLKLVNLTIHHMRAQALLQKNQEARPETAMALQAKRTLVRPILYLKVNPVVEVGQRLQVYPMLELKARPISSHHPNNQRDKASLLK